ncbi:cytochrome C oxidase subunit IV family protein, partial [Phycisphaerales bacterium AB-hyl4]
MMENRDPDNIDHSQVPQASSTTELRAPGIAADEPHDEHIHVVPMSLLVGIFVALLVLTVVTVLAIYIEAGDLNVWIALAIAVVKAALVALYFMHLRWDSMFNGMVLIASLLFVAIFIGFAITDSTEYRRNLTPPPGVQAPQ